MSFSDDLQNEFNIQAGVYDEQTDEVDLFQALAQAVCVAAIRNGYEANSLEVHQSYVNFEEIGGANYYRAVDRGEVVYCELADIMFVLYNGNEARICFMQNKYDRRKRSHTNFYADTRQLYLLKNRPPYWNGKGHEHGAPSEDILHIAEYSSITNYGVFVYDWGQNAYDMKYYNADSINPPTRDVRICKVHFDDGYNQYSTINTCKDQLNYAFTLESFGDGLAEMKIGQRYETIDDLLRMINVREVIDYFQERNSSDVVYDAERSSILARCVVIVNFQQDEERDS